MFMVGAARPPIDLNQLVVVEGKKEWNKCTKEVWEAVIWSLLYIIWKHRNELVFGRKNMQRSDELLWEVQWKTYNWIMPRLKKARKGVCGPSGAQVHHFVSKDNISY